MMDQEQLSFCFHQKFLKDEHNVCSHIIVLKAPIVHAPFFCTSFCIFSLNHLRASRQNSALIDQEEQLLIENPFNVEKKQMSRTPRCSSLVGLSQDRVMIDTSFKKPITWITFNPFFKISADLQAILFLIITFREFCNSDVL